MNHFPTKKADILKLLEDVSPVEYAKSRNYVSGSVTYLSPYISRGIFSTRDIFDYLKSRSYQWYEVEKLVQELVWRDYFQMVWMRLGENINYDIKQKQEPVLTKDMPLAVALGQTGIQGIDLGIRNLYSSGYMHNHQRMYTASVVCNIAKTHWLNPARWMYFHLLDADWASNACSWQWVAGSFSSKKYFANQENINRYCDTTQTITFLDSTYEELPNLSIPDVLMERKELSLKTVLPETSSDFSLNPDLPILIYNWYNLDFAWKLEEKVNRVLLLEPDVFEKYPICQKSVDFMLDLSKNIDGIKYFTGTFQELAMLYPNSQFVFKEHPLNNYSGTQENREFLHAIPEKNFNSFFGFWKYIEKRLKSDFNS